MGYEIRINEYQRKLVVQALKLLAQQPGLDQDKEGIDDEGEWGLTAGPTDKLEETSTLIELLEAVPKMEKDDPGTTHGLCL